jgi:hypothetical protein
MASPAQTIASLLVVEGLASRQADGTDWPVQVGEEPDAPDNTLTVYDTGFDQDGRGLRGERTQWPTIQVRVRSEDYPIGWEKGVEIQALFDAINRASVSVGTEIWNIEAIHISNPLMPIGEQEQGLRKLFVLNAALNLTKV